MYRLTQEEKDRALVLLQEVLSIKSVNGESREADVADYLKEYFSDTAYEASVHMVDERRGNFVLDVPGKKEKGYVVWNGHMDTVPYGECKAWSSDPAVPEIRGERIYGRGTSDMKGGLCAMAFALHYLSEHRLTAREHVRFLGTCDEEKGGTGAEALLKEGLFGKPDFLLIGEPTDCRVGIAQKGCMWLELTVRGRTSHGAYPWMGVNAAELGFELCKQIQTYISCQTHPILSQATAAVTRVEGGVANNMIPDAVRFVMDIRSVPGMTHEQLLREIENLKNIMEISYPGLHTEMRVLNERRPVELRSGHERAVQLRKAIERVSGKQPEDIGIYFFTDASVFCRKQEVPTLLFGPGSPALCHKPDEYMELSNYYRAIEVYIRLLTEE